MARRLILLSWAFAAAAAAQNTTTCDIIVRIGYPEGLAPYAVAAPTRWLDGDGARARRRPLGQFPDRLPDECVHAAGGLLDRPRGRRATPHHSSAFLAQGAVAGPDLAGIIVCHYLEYLSR